jgi:hypothetical protein
LERSFKDFIKSPNLSGYRGEGVKPLLYFFSDPVKFYAADPYTLLFALLLVPVFDAGFFSVDTTLATRLTPEKA